MSLLSQFFPSGGSGTGIRTNMLLVGGGGGGSPSGPLPPPSGIPSISPGPYTQPNPAPYVAVAAGGGGGGGQVSEFLAYLIAPGTQITVTVGSGGALNSNGGDTSVCIASKENIVMRGGRGSSSPIPSSSVPCYISFYDSSCSGGAGGTGCTTAPPTYPTHSFPCVAGSCGGFIYRGLTSNAISSGPGCCATCIIHELSDQQIVIRARSGDGPNGPTKSISPGSPNPSGPGRAPGIGGSGGGGATSPGSSGFSGASTPYQLFGACGGAGGNSYQSCILGSIGCYGGGGGGGGGNQVGPVSCGPRLCQLGTGGPSTTGGSGGQGSITPCFCNASAGSNGTANLGGGGGGGGAATCSQQAGGSGGSGTVIIQYPNAFPAAPLSPGACNCSPLTPGFFTYRFNGPGSITLP